MSTARILRFVFLLNFQYLIRIFIYYSAINIDILHLRRFILLGFIIMIAHISYGYYFVFSPDTGPVVERELDVEMFREELERFYLEDFCYVKSDPWDDTEFLLDRYFTYLSLNEEDRGSGTLKKIPLANSHNDIFNVQIDRRIPNRILVFGEGGSGKTTLCKKLAYDWAKKDSASPLKDVTVLCVLEFRKLLGSESIEEAIHSQLLCRDSEISPDQIKRYIRLNPSKIVIILDGYDEFNLKSKGDINDLLHSKIMAKVRVMVTTRPWPTCLLQQKKHMYAQLSLEGFDPQGIETYVRNYFAEEPIADACLAQIRANGALYALASTPIVLSMVCFVMKICSEDISQIDTMSKMFESFLRALFVKFLDKHSFDEGSSYTEPSNEKELKSKLREFWIGLGKLAVLAVGSEGKKIFFNEDEFPDDSVRVLGLKVGFLIRHKSKLSRMDALESPMTFYSFPHLMFQEKCAGDYLARNSGDFEWLITKIQSAERVFELQNTLAFACGKEENVEYAQTVMERLLHIKARDMTPPSRPIKTEGKGDLSDKLTEGLEYKNASLFNVALFINFESQSKKQHLNRICRILGYNLYQQVVRGIYCTHFLYYLDYAISEGISLPPCLSITLSESSKPVPLRDYGMQVMTAFSDITRIIINRCPIQFDLPNADSGDHPSAPYIDDTVLGMSILSSNDHISGMSTPKELILSGIPHPVAFSDLAKSASNITPKVSQVVLIDLEIEMPECYASEVQGYQTMPSLERFVMDHIKTFVSLKKSLYLTSLCPNMSSLEFYSCRVDTCGNGATGMTREPFPEEILLNKIAGTLSGSELLSRITAHPGVRRLKLEHCHLSLQSGPESMSDTSKTFPIEEVFLTNTGDTLHISDTVRLFRFYCKNLNLTYTSDSATGTTGPGECLSSQISGVSALEKLEVVSRGDPVSLPSLLAVITVLVPDLKSLYVEGNLVMSSALPDEITGRVPSLTVVHIKSVTEDISACALLTMMKVCSDLKTLVVDDCRLKGSPQVVELDGNTMQGEITLVFKNIRNTVPIGDIVDRVRKLGFMSVAFCFNNCSVHVTNPEIPKSETQSIPHHCEFGVSFENCTPSDSATTIQKYMAGQWPFMRLKVDGAKMQIFFTSKFSVHLCKVPLPVLLGESNQVSKKESKAKVPVDNISNFQDRSFLHFMSNHHKK